jgi:Fe-S-cluster containining protein
MTSNLSRNAQPRTVRRNSSKAMPTEAKASKPRSRPMTKNSPRARAKPDASKNRRTAKPAPAPALAKEGGKSARVRAEETLTPPPRRAATHLPLLKESRAPRQQPTCTACGLCCTYVAIEVDAPSTPKRATQLLFYLYHGGVSLYVNSDDWMVQFESTCQYLQPDYRCGVYDTRPHICREFSEKNCEVNTGDDGLTFYTAGEFMEHLKQTRPRVYRLVIKDYAPPPDAVRPGLQPFQRRARAVHARRAALGIAPPSV